ncbi:MAG: hypothetical protein WHS43_06340 [Aquificaceae bacterium]|jgi:hypothetical protein|uniref:hypothetical protein n=1 Tax=Hydrogenobacter sp. Uz 6-8 TaxID=3384828 RepID=UPI00309FDEE4
MERVYYLTDRFMGWLAGRDRVLYEKLIKQAEVAKAERYGDSLSFERGIALRFRNEDDSQTFGAILQEATLLWVNQENNFGFPEIPKKATSGEYIFLSDNFLRWLQLNKPEVIKEIESHIEDMGIDKVNFGIKSSPLDTGYYLLFSKNEDRELIGAILHRAVLDALTYIKETRNTINFNV